MNQDFTVKKKRYSSTKINSCRGVHLKKIPAQAVSEKKKKKIVRAENSPPPHHFSNGPSLNLLVQSSFILKTREDKGDIGNSSQAGAWAPVSSYF